MIKSIRWFRENGYLVDQGRSYPEKKLVCFAKDHYMRSIYVMADYQHNTMKVTVVNWLNGR